MSSFFDTGLPLDFGFSKAGSSFFDAGLPFDLGFSASCSSFFGAFLDDGLPEPPLFFNGSCPSPSANPDEGWTYPVLQAEIALCLSQLLLRLLLLHVSLLRQMPLAIRHDLAHMLLVFIGVLRRVLSLSADRLERVTLDGLRVRMSTILRPDSCPTDSPELSPLVHPVV